MIVPAQGSVNVGAVGIIEHSAVTSERGVGSTVSFIVIVLVVASEQLPLLKE
ncbi:hypothetical protein D3C86_2196280 [compost metagenome]